MKFNLPTFCLKAMKITETNKIFKYILIKNSGDINLTNCVKYKQKKYTKTKNKTYDIFKRINNNDVIYKKARRC